MTKIDLEYNLESLVPRIALKNMPLREDPLKWFRIS